MLDGGRAGGACDCSGLQDRTSLRPRHLRRLRQGRVTLFRSPRPDFIETPGRVGWARLLRRYCSGLQDRTSLRPQGLARLEAVGLVLFRSPRPDFIETRRFRGGLRWRGRDCSGLQDRTSLRRERILLGALLFRHCSGLQDRTSLRPEVRHLEGVRPSGLFRSPRPDFIETWRVRRRRARIAWSLFRSLRPDFIETTHPRR